MLKKYDSSSIKVLKGLEAVRKRPGMYIGDTDSGSGLHKMVFELVDNSIDETIAGYCSNIYVILRKDGSVTVLDDGRGIPVDFHKEESKSTVEIIMTVLHSGGKFDDNSYKISGGLHGVGLSVVNALSENLFIRIFKNGYVYEQTYFRGKIKNDMFITEKSDNTGTEITFLPDKTIFKSINFDYNFLLKRFREMSFLNSSLKITFIDKRFSRLREEILQTQGGLVAFVKYLNLKKPVINKDIIQLSGTIDEVFIDIGLQWIDSYKEDIYCYTNNVYQQDGGTHLVGFKVALTKVFKNYLNAENLNKTNLQISGEDIRAGIVAVISLRFKNPKFTSQTKDKLISLEIKGLMENFVTLKIKDFLYENPVFGKLLANRILILAKAREAAKKAKELVKKKDNFDIFNLSSKLADCREKNPRFTELFLVEGDSAGGSAKQARNRLTQAILPLKGKILNVEKSGFERLISSTEIASLISTLGCGLKDYDVNKLRYHKIIFMTDADVDGAHIRTLLLTFFYRQFPKIIENNHIYIAQPPLYKLYRGDFVKYVQDEKTYNSFLFNTVIDILLEKCKYLFSFNDENLFKEILYLYCDYYYVLTELSLKYPKEFFENLLFFGKFFDDLSYTSDVFFNMIYSFKDYINLKVSTNSRFEFDFKKNILIIKYLKYGVFRNYILEFNFFKSNNYKIIKELNIKLNMLFNSNDFILFDDIKYKIEDFHVLINNFLLFVKNKYKVQRYKGLGEMNPSQLWETTMNPESRNLSLIKVNDARVADKIFSDLMGDDIFERKKFITNHALSVIDLDL